MNKEYLVTLNVPPALEGMVVDNLLMMEFGRGFSGFPVFAHHHENKGLSIAEQVTGRQKKIRFQMYVNENDLEKLLQSLQDAFSGSGVEFWVMPVLQNGVF
jgi:hypothetical protein